MRVWCKEPNYKLYEGNMLELTEAIKPNSIDSIVTDPPYELNFMNKGWDNSGIAFQADTWRKCYEVLKPGAYLLAFGGSRTFHRIACAIEDAGFEIRDTIMWIYGSGFPKSLNIANSIEGKLKLGTANKKDYKHLEGERRISSLGYHKTNAADGYRPNDYSGQETVGKVNLTTDLAIQWQGWGTALKPSYEPIIVARKPVEGTTTDNVMKYGVGGINIDECRVGDEVIKGGTTPDFRDVGKKSKDAIGIDKLSFGQVSGAKGVPLEDHTGRFPANTILTYDETDIEEVCGGFPNTKSGIAVRHNSGGNTFGGNKKPPMKDLGYTDEGSAARYFYCAKASKKDRDEGLDGFAEQKTSMMATNANIDKDGKFTGMLSGRNTKLRNIHPTVKPTTLMQYLVRLVTPNGGTVLDPFNGSGSTGKAVMYENKERHKDYKYIGIELNKEYLEISKARIDCVIDTKEPEEPEQITMDWRLP